MIKHAYILEARGHPGHDVIRNFYQSQGLKDGKLYNKQGRCVGDDQMVTRMVQNHEGQEIEQKGWQGGDGENTVNLKQIIQATYATMVSRFLILRGAGHKFTPGVATMWARGEFGQNFDSGNVNTFNESLNLLVKFHSKDYDKFLRNIANGDTDTPTADEIIDRFSQARSENIQGVKDRINSKEYENTKYFIRPITEYDDLLRYKKLCYSKNVWCLMNGEQAWINYTSNGSYQFYLVLDNRLCDENGNPIIENKDVIPAEQGEGHPNDEYGLSMMGIIVDSTGELAYCTTRWNHAGKGDDHTMTSEEISDTLGVNFYQTFLPNHKFQDVLDKAMNRFHETGSLDSFNGYYENGIEGFMKVFLLKKTNILNTQTGELLSDIWFDHVDEFSDGLAQVNIKNKGYNYINTNGELLSKKWFKYIGSFTNGFAIVKINNKETFINTKGEFITDKLFDGAFSFSEKGIARVYLNEKGYNFINTNGDFLCDIWFEKANSFKDNFARVKIKNKGWNYINSNGKILSDICFNTMGTFENGLADVFLSNKGCNFINTNGELISNIWFDDTDDFNEGFASVAIKGKGWNYINTNGELISDIWFDYTYGFYNGFASVSIKGKGWNYINTNGELISDIWFDNILSFENGFAQVYIKSKGYNFINTNGELVSDIWFDNYQDLDYGFGFIQKNNKCNILNDNKEPISIIWFDQINEVSQDYMIVMLNGTKYILKVNGDLYDIKNKFLNKPNKFIKNVSPNGNNEQIANESLRRKYTKELNEVLDLNKRIKRLYE